LLGYLKDDLIGAENSLPVYRNSFLSSVNLKGNNDNIIISLSKTEKNKIRIESTDGNAYTVLSTVTQ
jgi:hypothetical protein